jgi:hypothetical protein
MALASLRDAALITSCGFAVVKRKNGLHPVETNR